MIIGWDPTFYDAYLPSLGRIMTQQGLGEAPAFVPQPSFGDQYVAICTYRGTVTFMGDNPNIGGF
jgi:hypothetical protein